MHDRPRASIPENLPLDRSPDSLPVNRHPAVGNIRTAFQLALSARRRRLVLRIEDTDQTGSTRVPEAILESTARPARLAKAEVGSPYGAASRAAPLYHRADELIAKDAAYRCFCSTERLEQVRAEQTRRKEPPRYDRRCRNFSEAEREEEEAKGIVPVVRFKTPLDGRTEFDDVVRGHVTFENETLDDFVLLKSDGYPTYHLANVVDDHLMEITHVLRADEWLPSTPRHLLLYAALGFEPPVFAHLPMILGSDRAKLSKRHGAVSLLEYKRQGYAEAMFNSRPAWLVAGRPTRSSRARTSSTSAWSASSRIPPSSTSRS
jgi:glutamyl-tRNA synthetase